MTKFSHALAASLAISSAAMAQTTTLAPPADRIGDAVIQEDHAAFGRIRARVAAAEPVQAPTPAPMRPSPPPSPRGEKPVVREAGVVFAFDRADRAGITAASMTTLVALLRQLDADRLQVMSVRVVGHADRLNGTGDGRYNQRLSERRAATVKAILVGRGIAAAAIETAAEGDAAPVERCDSGGDQRSRVALQACLQPNRRVDIAIAARREN